MRKPLAIDLFCGLGGWTEGLLAEGYDVIGFDIERHEYGDEKYPAQLVIQDVLTLHGSQFKDADLIVASPPCQGYSYRAMPWSRAKALPPPDNSLFEACFRIQREAIEATGARCPECDGSTVVERYAGHGDKWDDPCKRCNAKGFLGTRHIPLVVENVRGAQKWVGRSRWNYGSFHLWGDVPALMPASNCTKLGGGASWCHPSDPRHQPGLDFTRLAGRKNAAESGIKQGGDWFNKESGNSISRRTSSKSKARKRAAATIAKIPLPLSRYIGQVFKP